jgi:hypothetical protein
VGFLRPNLFDRLKSSYTWQRRSLCRVFWHVITTKVDCNSTMYVYDVVEGIMKLHSICSMNKNNSTTLLVKSLACFCVYCVDGLWDQCLNLPWIGSWIFKHLQPLDTQFVKVSL